MKIYLTLCVTLFSLLYFVESSAKGRIEVKAFIHNDAETYSGLEVKYIPGANPELVILGDDEEEAHRFDLSDMKRTEINDLVVQRGFIKKESDVPEPPGNDEL